MTTEDLWWRIIIVIVLALFLTLFIVNTIYYNRIMNGSCLAISNSTATTLFWFNLIWCGVVGAILIWAIIRLFFGRSTTTKAYTEGEFLSRDPGFGTAVATSAGADANIVSANTIRAVEQNRLV